MGSVEGYELGLPCCDNEGIDLNLEGVFTSIGSMPAFVPDQANSGRPGRDADRAVIV